VIVMESPSSVGNTTRQFNVASAIGGGAPLADAGSELVRVTMNTAQAMVAAPAIRAAKSIARKAPA